MKSVSHEKRCIFQVERCIFQLERCIFQVHLPVEIYIFSLKIHISLCKWLPPDISGQVELYISPVEYTSHSPSCSRKIGKNSSQ